MVGIIVGLHDGRGVSRFGFAQFWDPRPNEAVNKRDLSTGENGERGAEVALGRRPARVADSQLFTLRKAAKTATHSKCFGYRRSLETVRCCQQNGDRSSKLKFWLGRNCVGRNPSPSFYRLYNKEGNGKNSAPNCPFRGCSSALGVTLSPSRHGGSESVPWPRATEPQPPKHACVNGSKGAPRETPRILKGTVGRTKVR